MKMRIKRILSAVCFMLILSFMLHRLTNIFYPNSVTYQSFETYNDLDKDTVDVIALGTSCTYNAWLVPRIWNETGISMFTLATSAQPFGMTTEIIEDAMRNQCPELVIIDIHGFKRQGYNFSQSRTRPVTDCFGFINKFRYMDKILDKADAFYDETGSNRSLDNTDYSYYFPLIKYHSRWKEGLEEMNFTGRVSKWMGYYNVIGNRNIAPTEVTSDTCELLQCQEDTLNEIIKWGKEHSEVKLLFVNLPSHLSYEEQTDLNTAIKKLKENGYPVINMNTEEMYSELGIDFSKDLRDRNHLNIYGSEKVTSYLINYLKENYDLKDHRGDSKYSRWQSAWKDFSNEYKKIIKKQTKKPVPNRIECDNDLNIRFLWNRTYCADGYVILKKVNEGEWNEVAVIEDSTVNTYNDTVKKGEVTSYTLKAYKDYNGKRIFSGYDEKGVSIKK